MEEIIANIVEKINFDKKVVLTDLLNKCIRLSTDSGHSSYAVHENIIFKMDLFFKGFPAFIHEFGKDKKYEAGVEALSVITDELGFDIDKSECFILFHLRDQGKFRMKESTLHDQLKIQWNQYKHYALEDQAFSYALKNLMRMKFISYRKRNLHILPTVIVRFR